MRLREPNVRVVTDTNTFVSACLWRGLPAEVLAAARFGRLSLFTSPALLAELEDVLARPKFSMRIAAAGSSVAQLVSGYRALATVVRAQPIARTTRGTQMTTTCSPAPCAPVIRRCINS